MYKIINEQKIKDCLTKKDYKFIYIDGPVSSGKTYIWEKCCNDLKLVTLELSGFDQEKLLDYIGSVTPKSKGVYEILGYKGYNKSPQVIIIEDFDVVNIAIKKRILAIKTCKVPIILINSKSYEMGDLIYRKDVLTIHMRRPFVSEFQEPQRCKAELYFCDMRKINNIFQSDRVDVKEAPPSVNTRNILNKQIIDIKSFENSQEINYLLFENYIKLPDIKDITGIADYLSLSDIVRTICQPEKDLFNVILPASKVNKGVCMIIDKPQIIDQMMLSKLNREKIPSSITYDLIEYVGRRIIKALQNPIIPIKNVILEMKSNRLTTIEQWEAIKNIAFEKIEIENKRKEEFYYQLIGGSNPKIQF
jgi:hypothetical protein